MYCKRVKIGIRVRVRVWVSISMTVTTNVDGMLSLRIMVLKKHGVRNSRGKKHSHSGQR
jgi:hypothetical protein